MYSYYCDIFSFRKKHTNYFLFLYMYMFKECITIINLVTNCFNLNCCYF